MTTSRLRVDRLLPPLTCDRHHPQTQEGSGFTGLLRPERYSVAFGGTTLQLNLGGSSNGTLRVASSDTIVVDGDSGAAELVLTYPSWNILVGYAPHALLAPSAEDLAEEDQPQALPSRATASRPITPAATARPPPMPPGPLSGRCWRARRSASCLPPAASRSTWCTTAVATRRASRVSWWRGVGECDSVSVRGGSECDWEVCVWERRPGTVQRIRFHRRPSARWTSLRQILNSDGCRCGIEVGTRCAC